jgi:rSAM/selenodomain-associated transferase 2
MPHMISIIIPVYKEPEISAVISNVVEQNYPDFEILVIDGEESGRTIGLINNKSIKKYISQPGRAHQMNFGAEKATGDILLFLHADTILPVGALSKVSGMIAAGYEAGCFDLQIDSNNFLLREIISKTSSIRSRITRLPYGDQALFFRSEFFKSIGGFPAIPLMEDIAIMQIILKLKKKIVILPDRVTTSDRRWLEEGILYVMLRNPILAALYMLGVSPEKLKKFYL